MLSVGEILKKTREEKGLSLKDIEKKLRIREKFLNAVEKNDWNFFSSKVYIEGIIKNYSNILGLEAKKIIAFFRREYEVNEEIKFKKKVSSKYLTPETKKIAFIGLILLVLFFLFYFGYQIKLFILPPGVVYLGPKTEIFKRDEKIKIVFKTEKEASVTVFGERIYPNADGVYSYDLPLIKGENEFIAEITGANGKKTSFRKIYIREQ